jgi:hypothetical protein
MCQFYSQNANYRNNTTQITTDSKRDTNETDETKTNKQNNIWNLHIVHTDARQVITK